MTADIIALVIKLLIVVVAIMLSVPMLVWMERKVVADFQARIGPNRVGPYGLLQSFADGIKLFLKEDITPTNVDKVLFLLAPVVVMLPALSLFAVIPFGPPLVVGGKEYWLQLAVGRHLDGTQYDVPVGVLYLLAISSLGVYGIVLSGWSSNSKYSLLGGLRSSAQMVSYELPMGLAVIAAVMIASRSSGTLSLASIVNSQSGWFWNWNFLWWGIPGVLAFVIYLLCGIAETNRAPFDLPEAETELVAGYHTEYSSMKFAMFFLAEYANMINVSAVATTLFLGGWHSPIPLQIFPQGTVMAALGGIFWFTFKIFLLILFYMWLRATTPRLRYDQLMKFTWKGLVPAALLNIMLVAILLTIFHPGKLSEAAQVGRTAPAPPASGTGGQSALARPSAAPPRAVISRLTSDVAGRSGPGKE
jgi:NADH-quinone oxidoreductase subunit H